MNNFPYPYYFYGSHDSIDSDVLIEIPEEKMPVMQEDRKKFLKQLETEYNLHWNTNLIVVKNGYVTDTVYTKTWIDSINNSLFTTYILHEDKQKFPLPIIGELKRNKLLAIYKTVRTILAMLSRTNYRSTIKPILKGIHPFNLKINELSKIDFTTIDGFNQDNTEDVDIWKIIAFYLGQNISLLKDNNEIYTKITLVANYPEFHDFIYRKEITLEHKMLLNEKINLYVNMLHNYGNFICEDNIMYCEDEKIDMKNEISI